MTVDLDNPFIREAWSILDEIDRKVGLDPAMFPFPEREDRFASNPHVRTRFELDCRCCAEMVYSQMHEAREHYRNCDDATMISPRYEKATA